MSDFEYKYHWQPSADAWYIRAPVWLWEIDPDKLDFCKFFWGWVAFLPGLMFRSVIELIVFIGRLGAPGRERRKAERNLEALKRQRERANEPQPPKPKRARQKMKGLLLGLSTAGASFVMSVDRGAAFIARHKAIVFVLQAILFGVLTAIVLGTVGVLIYCIVLAWSVIRWILLASLAGLLFGLALWGLVNLLSRLDWQLPNPELEFPDWPARRAKQLGNSLSDFGYLFVEGFRAVKSNTCPKIEVKK